MHWFCYKRKNWLCTCGLADRMDYAITTATNNFIYKNHDVYVLWWTDEELDPDVAYMRHIERR